MERLEEINARLTDIQKELMSLSAEKRALNSERNSVLVEAATAASAGIIGKRAVWNGSGRRRGLSRGTIGVYDPKAHRFAGTIYLEAGSIIVISDGGKAAAEFRPDLGWTVETGE